MRKTDEVGHVRLVPRLSLVTYDSDLSVFLLGGSKVICGIIVVGGIAW